MSDPQTASAFTGPSFSLANRIARIAWGIVSAVFFRLSPRPFHAWRRWLLTLFGANVGKGCHVYPGVRIWAPWNVTFGEECGVGDGAILYSQARITLGKRAVISQGSHLCTGTHDYESDGFELFAKPITIGDHAWIAAECFVHPGVQVGEGTVVGARSVITKDLPPWMVCTGNPCRPVKPRTMKGRVPEQ